MHNDQLFTKQNVIMMIYLSKPHGIRDTLTVGKKGHMKYKLIQVTIDYLKKEYTG